MSIDPRNGDWNKELEGGMPDCRLKVLDRDKLNFLWGYQNIKLDLFFCAVCGEPGGGVGPDCPFIFYLCDNCAGVHGNPPGLVRVG